MPKFFGTFSERLDLNGAVKEAVISVEMKVCESLFRHKCNERADYLIGNRPKKKNQNERLSLYHARSSGVNERQLKVVLPEDPDLYG